MPDDSMGRRLLWVRRDRGLTQVELSAASGIRQSAISELERGAAPVTDAMVRKLAEALDPAAIALILGVDRLDGD